MLLRKLWYQSEEVSLGLFCLFFAGAVQLASRGTSLTRITETLALRRAADYQITYIHTIFGRSFGEFLSAKLWVKSAYLSPKLTRTCQPVQWGQCSADDETLFHKFPFCELSSFVCFSAAPKCSNVCTAWTLQGTSRIVFWLQAARDHKHWLRRS